MEPNKLTDKEILEFFEKKMIEFMDEVADMQAKKKKGCLTIFETSDSVYYNVVGDFPTMLALIMKLVNAVAETTGVDKYILYKLLLDAEGIMDENNRKFETMMP